MAWRPTETVRSRLGIVVDKKFHELSELENLKGIYDLKASINEDHYSVVANRGFKDSDMKVLLKKCKFIDTFNSKLSILQNSKHITYSGQ